MLNFRLLYILLDSRSIRVLLGMAACAGFGILIDFVLILKLSLLTGPWITMAILAVLTAAGAYIAYSVVEKRNGKVVTSIDEGDFETPVFFSFLTALLSAICLILPGFLSSILGAVLLIPALSEKTGKMLSSILGIQWPESYEYLRLERLTHNAPAVETRHKTS